MQPRNFPSVDDRALHLPLQPVAEDIWSRKYCLRAADGGALDASPDATLERVATALAAVLTKVRFILEKILIFNFD